MGVQAASDGDPRRSALLVQYVLNVFSCEKMLCMPLRDAVKSPDVRAWFQSVAALPLVEAERTGHAVQYTQKKLYAFEEVAVPEHHEYRGRNMYTIADMFLVWTQRPILRNCRYLNKELRTLLQIPPASVEDTVANLLYVCRQGKQGIAMVSTARTESWFNSMMAEIYAFLALVVNEAGVKQDKDARRIVESLKDEQCMLFVPSIFQPGDHSPHFLRPNELFFHLEVSDIPPFCHHVSGLPSVLTTRGKTLLQALGVREFPAVEDILEWIGMIHSTFVSAPLDDKALESMVSLLNLLSKLNATAEQMSRIYAPDTRKVLTAAESLVLDDTPWLRPRIRYDLVRVAHPAIKDFARFIGVRRLSEAVEERVDRGSALSRVPAGAAPELEQWGGNVRTLAFRNGIKRILFDEGRSLQRKGSDPDGDDSVAATKRSREVDNATSAKDTLDITGRVHALADVQFVPVTELRSQFILRSTGQDISKEKVGSNFLVDGGGDNSASGVVVYLVADTIKKNRWITLFAMAVNQLLDKKIKNLQPVEKILDCKPAEIDEYLSFLRITAPPDGFSDHLGMPLERSAKERLAPATSALLVPGTEIAWRPAGSGVFKYGRVSSYRVNDSTVEIEVSPVNVAVVPVDAVRLIRTMNEYHSDRIKAAEDEVVEQTKIRNLDAALFPDLDNGTSADHETNPGSSSGTGTIPVNHEESATPIERVEYRPPVAQWEEHEEAVLQHLKEKNVDNERQLEDEPPGIDELLEVQGFEVPQNADKKLASKIGLELGTNVRRGYDLVRWGNLDDVAFFHERGKPFTDERQRLARQCVDVLRDVSTVFDYDVAYVTMFYQPKALSRFIKQKLMYNIWPIEEHAREAGISDVRNDPFAYMYFYGLHIHKLGHFHDIVHGTRHDFYMNELRVEFILEWLALLERKGFDPAKLETSELGERMLKSVVF